MIDLAFLTKPDNFNLQWTFEAICSHFTVGYVLSLVFYLFWMRLFVRFSKKIFDDSFFVAFVGGLASLVIDADHAVMFFGQESEYSRPLHLTFALMSWVAVMATTLKLIICRLDMAYQKNVDMKRVVVNIFVWIISIDWIVHVIEDYTLGWF